MKRWSLVVSLFVGLVLVPLGRAEEDPLKDPDLQDALKQAQELQKESGPAKSAKMSDLKKQADEIQAQQEKGEAAENAKQQAALKKQLATSSPAVFPDWTPKMPEMKPDGPVTRKIIDDQICTVVTGTSTLTPAQLGDAWEKEKTDKVNIGRSNNIFNDLKQVIIYVHPRDDFDKEVRMVAERRGDEKVTRVTITSPLPKPDLEGDE